MRYLVISIICSFAISCTSYVKKNNYKTVVLTENTIINPYFSDTEKDYVYKAKIKVYDHDFGGIFIVKKMMMNVKNKLKKIRIIRIPHFICRLFEKLYYIKN